MTDNFRYTGFDDPSGKQIFEGDYLILDLNDLTTEQLEARKLKLLVENAGARYMQAYIQPSQNLQYDVQIIILDNEHTPITDAKYYYIADNDGSDEKEWMADFGKHNSLTNIYTCLVLSGFREMLGFKQDNLWYKKDYLYNMVDFEKTLPPYEDSAGNKITLNNHYLFSIHDSVFENFDALFYNSNLGKEMKELSAKHMLIYVMPSKYFTLDLAVCFYNKENMLITIDEKENLSKYTEQEFKSDGIDILTVDKQLPYVSYCQDSFNFIQYLLAKKTLILEKSPLIDLSKYKHLFKN